MRLSNLEEGSYNNTPEPKKMQVTVADKKANTEAWKRYQAGDSRYEFKNPKTESEITEAGGYYTQPVYDMIEKHGYEKVMHELLTSLHADVIQDFISRAELDEGKSPHKKGTAKYKKHMAAMHAEGTHSDAKPIYDLVGSLGAGKIELADNPIFHNLVRFLDADTIEKFVADFRKNMDDGNPMEDEFKPHMMYDPKTGKGTHAKKEKDHLDMKDKGYTHDNPKTKKVEEDTKGRDESVKNIDEILVKMGADAPGDIIADIMHWIDAHPGENLEDLIRQANGYYNDELDETKINEFGPDERYMKVGNNTMIANKKTGSISSTLSLGGDKTATVNNHLNRDGSAGKVSARGTVNVSGTPVKFKASNSISGNNFKGSVSAGGMTVNASKEPKVREAGSPWTTTGKHPEKMTPDELWNEIAVFDHIQDRGERLTPKDMMRLDSLFSYMDTAEMNEQIKSKADSMMESAVWKAKRNK